MLLPQVALYSMYVACMAFHAKVSDPLIGGTYMTLLNTVTNLGGNWPSTLALWMVDPLTSKECQGAVGQSCGSAEAAGVSKQQRAEHAQRRLSLPHLNKLTILLLFPSPAVCEGGRHLCDNTGRLLRGVSGVCCDRSGLVGVLREENEAAAGTEPSCMEVQSQSLMTLLSSVPFVCFNFTHSAPTGKV